MLLLIICLLTFSTSAISGVFGMAGGMILMGALPGFLLPGQALLLHGIIQGFANLHRSLQFIQGIDWRGVRLYIIGSILAYLLVRELQFVPDRAVLYLLLSLAAFLGACSFLPKSLGFGSIRGAMICGLSVTGLQLIAGVAGPLLDMFFRDREVKKEDVVATKSVTQVFSHGLKIILMGELMWGKVDILVFSAKETGLILGCSALGTALGKKVLLQMTQVSFYRWTSKILMALAGFYLFQAVQMQMR